MRLKVLITGASGFTGYNLISAAVDAGTKVHAAAKTAALQHFNLRYVIPGYTDQGSLCKLPEQYHIPKEIPRVHMLRIHVPAPLIRLSTITLTPHITSKEAWKRTPNTNGFNNKDGKHEETPN